MQTLIGHALICAMTGPAATNPAMSCCHMLITKIDPSVSDNLPRDPRDRYGPRLRRAALAQLEDLHQANRDKPLAPLGWSIEGVFGAKGSGKTARSIGRLAEAYAAGYRVISLNAGALFGYTLADPRDYYLLLGAGLHDTVVLVDEIHTLMASMGAGTIRQRHAMDATAGTRKMSVPQIYISQQESQTAGALRGEINWVYYPQQLGYAKYVDKYGWLDREDGSLAPDCFMQLHRIGPDPYEARKGTLADEMGIRIRPGIEKKTLPLTPRAVDSWMRLYWSFTPVQTGLAFSMAAKETRKRFAATDELVWSDELSQEEQAALSQVEGPDGPDAEPEETPGQRAARCLSDMITLMRHRILDPLETRCSIAHATAALRDHMGWEPAHVRLAIREYLTLSSDARSFTVASLASRFAPEIWLNYVVNQVDPDETA